MTKYTYLLIAICCAIYHPLISQQNTFFNINTKGVPVQINANPILNANNVSGVNYTKRPNNWIKGNYFDSANLKHTAFILFHHAYIYTKPDSASKNYTKISASNLTSVVLGTDSFVVINNYVQKDSPKNKPVFAKYLGTINGNQFVEFGKQKGNQNPKYISTPITEYSYLMKINTHSNWLEVGNKKSAIPITYLYNIDVLKSKFSAMGNVKEKIEHARNYFAYSQKTALSLDSNWNFNPNPNKKQYAVSVDTVEIERVKFSVWDDAILKANFTVSNIARLNLIDTQTVYFSNGQPEYKYIYNKRGLAHSVAYTQNGDTANAYSLVPLTSPSTYDTIMQIQIEKFKNDGDLFLETVDPRTNNRYYQTYKNGILMESYRKDGQVKIYQPLRLRKELSMSKIQTAFAGVSLSHYYLTAFHSAKFTSYHIKIVLNPKGEVQDAELINSHGAVADEWMTTQINELILNDGPKKFKGYKHQGEKVFCEFTLSVQIRIKYVPPANGHQLYYDPSNMYMNQTPQMKIP